MTASATHTIVVDGGPGAPGAARARVLEAIGDDLSPTESHDLMLALGELVTNAVVHGGADGDEPVRIDLAMERETIGVNVSDPGPGFEYERKEPDPDRIGGLGLYLVDQIARDWGVECDPRCRVWMDFPREAAA